MVTSPLTPTGNVHPEGVLNEKVLNPINRDGTSCARVDFQGKDPGETFQFYFRQHWIRLLPSFCRMLGGMLLTFGLGYVLFITVGITDPFARRLILLILLTTFILTQLEFLLRFYRYFLYVIIVTDKRVHRIKKTLITTDEHETMDLWMLQDIDKRQRGIIQNLFGFGSLTLDAQDSELRIHFTPRIAEKYRVIASLRERARWQMPGSLRGMQPMQPIPG